MNELQKTGIAHDDAGDSDLAHVDPRQLAEIKHRIAVLRGYNVLVRRSSADAEHGARQLGMSPSNFMRLAKALRETGRLPEGGTMERRSRAVTASRRGIAKETREIIESTIDGLGMDARFTDVLIAARAACTAAGIPCPSQGSIWTIAQARAVERRRQGPQRSAILLARCCLGLHVAVNRDITWPRVLLAVALPEGRALACASSFSDEPPPGIEAVMAEVGGSPDISLRERTFLADPADAAKLLATPPANVVQHPGERAYSLLRKTIGLKLDTIAISSSSRRKPPTGLSGMSPLTEDQAREAIRHAMDRHNARLGAIGQGQ